MPIYYHCIKDVGLTKGDNEELNQIIKSISQSIENLGLDRRDDYVFTVYCF